MKKAEVKILRGNEQQIEGELVLKERKVYMLKNEKLRMEIIQLYHDVLEAEHSGRWKMTELVMRNYQWPGVTNNIGKYVEGCNMCYRMKNRTEILAGELMANKVLEQPLTCLTVDFITKLLLVAVKDMILVVYNRLSKMTHFVATTEGMSVEGLVRLFRNNVWKLHGLPKSMILDRKPQFAVKLMKELNDMLEIETNLLTSFYLQTDGQTE